MSEFKIFEYEVNTIKLPAGKEGPVFVILADLHNHVYGPGNGRLTEAICRQKPDAVLVAGDLLIGHSQIPYEPALELVRSLRRRDLPVYYGNGNHEYRMRMHPEIYGKKYEEYASALRDCGVILLENEKAAFEARGLKAEIYGFELPERYYTKFCREKLPPEELSDALGTPKPERYNILLAHNPVYFDEYAGWGADLTLSGHLHGGIIRIPGIGGVITPQARLFPRYDAGHFQRCGRDLIVSRGLGTHTVNIRIFNPAELSVIRIRGTGEPGPLS